MLAEQHCQGSLLSKVVENNFGTTNGIEQNGHLCNYTTERHFVKWGGLGKDSSTTNNAYYCIVGTMGRKTFCLDKGTQRN